MTEYQHNHIVHSYNTYVEIDRLYNEAETLAKNNDRMNGDIKSTISTICSIPTYLIGGFIFIGSGLLLQLIIPFEGFIAVLLALIMIAISLCGSFLINRRLKDFVWRLRIIGRKKLVKIEENCEIIDKNSHLIESLATRDARFGARLPEKYRCAKAANAFLTYVDDDDLSTAIELYEEALHRERLENMSQQMLENQKRQAAMIADIQSDSSLAATFSIMNYFLR